MLSFHGRHLGLYGAYHQNQSGVYVLLLLLSASMLTVTVAEAFRDRLVHITPNERTNVE